MQGTGVVFVMRFFFTAATFPTGNTRQHFRRQLDIPIVIIHLINIINNLINPELRSTLRSKRDDHRGATLLIFEIGGTNRTIKIGIFILLQLFDNWINFRIHQ